MRHLAVHTFVAASHGNDSCGSNGLPLTPNSIHIVGRFQSLASLQHPNLCEYLDISRDKHERLIIVSEHYSRSLITARSNWNDAQRVMMIMRAAKQVLECLKELHSRGIIHHNLSPSNILLSDDDQVKLSNYGLYYMTRCGTEVDFPIGDPRYIAPECVLEGANASFTTDINDASKHRRGSDANDINTFTYEQTAALSVSVTEKVDIWMLGMCVLESLLSTVHERLWPNRSLEQVLERLADFYLAHQAEIGATQRKTEAARQGNRDAEWDSTISEFELTSRSALRTILDDHDGLFSFDVDVSNFLDQCLSIDPRSRPSAAELLKHSLFQNHSGSADDISRRADSFIVLLGDGREAIGDDERETDAEIEVELAKFTSNHTVYRTTKFCSVEKLGDPVGLDELLERAKVDNDGQSFGRFDQPEEPPISNHRVAMLRRTSTELYYFWKLAGGDLRAVLRDAGLINEMPTILQLPLLALESGERYGAAQDSTQLFDDRSALLSIDPLIERLKVVDVGAFYPLTETETDTQLTDLSRSQTDSAHVRDIRGLNLAVKEQDVEYQLHRVILFERLLRAYPHTRMRIVREARMDIPPLYRAETWAALLGVRGDVQRVYDSVPLNSATSADRQIEVDIPRCHQYDELLSSAAGHTRLKSVIKCWLITHVDEFVYWQGIDSLCAPFVRLNFTNPALAFASFDRFVAKYLCNMFLKDNTKVIQEYLATFSNLIAYWDAELYNHLDDICFAPDLYSIPWFLTMFAHVFPLQKIFHLWDALLLFNDSFPLCIGVAILLQIKDKHNLMQLDFNECILLFSDLPDIDIDRCVADAKRIYCRVPRSCVYRPLSIHCRPPPKSRASSEIASTDSAPTRPFRANNNLASRYDETLYDERMSKYDYDESGSLVNGMLDAIGLDYSWALKGVVDGGGGGHPVSQDGSPIRTWSPEGEGYSSWPANMQTIDDSDLTLEEVKAFRCLRMYAEDLVELLGLAPPCPLFKKFSVADQHSSSASASQTRSSEDRASAQATAPRTAHFMLIDIRAKEEFQRGALPNSLNVPFATAFNAENELVNDSLFELVREKKNAIKVIVGARVSVEAEFAQKLIRLGVKRVCILHRGIEALKGTSYLVVQ